MKLTRTSRLAVALMLLPILLFALDAQAILIPLTAAMTGAKANAGAGTGSPGTGTATVTFDTATSALTWRHARCLWKPMTRWAAGSNP